MVRRRRKRKKRKYLGSRTFGAGGTKKRRGKGGRGGRGWAGAHKHRFTYIVKYAPKHFGKRGFIPIIKKPRIRTINVGDIEDMIKSEKLKAKEGKFYLEFPGKVLGTGKLKSAVNIKAIDFSERAKKKIEEAGGKAEEIKPIKSKREKPEVTAEEKK